MVKLSLTLNLSVVSSSPELKKKKKEYSVALHGLKGKVFESKYIERDRREHGKDGKRIVMQNFTTQR